MDSFLMIVVVPKIIANRIQQLDYPVTQNISVFFSILICMLSVDLYY